MAALMVVSAPLGATEPESPDTTAFEKADQPPKPIKLEPPRYPADLRRAGLIGEVKLRFIITTEGKVTDPFVVESNNPAFERPAIDALLKWKFEPARKGGRPVNTRIQQVIHFNLDSDSARTLWEMKKAKDHDRLPAQVRWETPPVPKGTAFPVYPFEALADDRKGRAVVNFLVGSDGKVVAAKLMEQTAPEFGRAVLAAIDTWSFKPAKNAEKKACGAYVSVAFDFSPTRGEVPVSDYARWILGDLKKHPERIVELKDLDAEPKPLSRRPPTYPSALLAQAQPGEAMVEFFIDERGDAQLPRAMSATAPEFGDAAVQAVATWRFYPPKKNGKAVTARVQVPVKFSLKEPRPAAATPASSP